MEVLELARINVINDELVCPYTPQLFEALFPE
jgi:hypothetical protein